MASIKKFEELDHLDFLKKEKELRDQKEQSHRQKLEDIGKEKSGKDLHRLAKEVKEREKHGDIVSTRQNLVQKVIDGINNDVNGKSPT